MLGHDHYRTLAALAAIGQISSKEEAELHKHLQWCAECEQVQSDYNFIVSRQLSLRSKAASERDSPSYPVPMARHIRDSFLARARAEGVHFSRDSEQELVPAPVSRRSASMARLGAVATIVLGICLYESMHLHRAVDPQSVAETPRERPAAAAQSLPAPQQQIVVKKTGIDPKAFASLQQKLADDEQREQELVADLETSRAAYNVLVQQMADRDRELAEERSRNDQVTAQLASQSANVSARDAQIAALTRSLEAQSQDLERERQLNEASKDVRQLMGTRKLHIIDVHDVTGSQASARAFGRVFYAEGQSLIFYAFDLPRKSRNPSKFTFEAWGQNDGHPSLVHCLGSFGIDDHDQQRWILKVEDPSLLAGINSVFVTAESPRYTETPHGEKLLYAYLAGVPNHP